jgi:ParB family chromosome partitioning protein
LRDKDISMGHASALLSIENEDKQLAIFAMAVESELSVREVEELARGEKLQFKPKIQPASKPLTIEDKQISKKLEKIFSNSFSFKRNAKGQGTLSLKFKNDNELEHILSYFDIN